MDRPATFLASIPVPAAVSHPVVPGIAFSLRKPTPLFREHPWSLDGRRTLSPGLKIPPFPPFGPGGNCSARHIVSGSLPSNAMAHPT